MYGLPPNIDLRFLTGQTLIQVCIGEHDLILHFDDDTSITVTSSVGCTDSRKTLNKSSEFYQIASDLLLFISQIITSCNGSEDGTLILEFDTGGTLFVYDDSKEYESYTIRHGDELIVV